MEIRTPFRMLPGAAEAMGRVAIDPPFRIEKSRPGDASAVDALLSAVTGYPKSSVAVTGPAGSGKSFILTRAFKEARSRGLPHAVLAKARLLDPRAAGSGAFWEGAEGVAEGAGTRTEALFREGKLQLFIDGLDENPGLADLDYAAKNRLVISWRGGSPAVSAIDGAGRSPTRRTPRPGAPARPLPFAELRVMELPAWGLSRAAALFRAVAATPRSSAALGGFARLARIPARELEARLGAPVATPAALWAAGFAASEGAAFSGSREALRLAAASIVREACRRGSVFPAETLTRILVRTASAALRSEARGLLLDPGELLACAFEERKTAVPRAEDAFAALVRTGMLEFDPVRAGFAFDPVFAEALAEEVVRPGASRSGRSRPDRTEAPASPRAARKGLPPGPRLGGRKRSFA